MNTHRYLSIVSLGLLASVALGQARSTSMVEVSGFVPMGVSTAKPLGLKAGSDVLHLAIGIKPADLAGLQSFVDSVSNPKSPTYRRYVTPQQVGQMFGLPMPHVQRIASYLAANGMTVKLIAKNRFAILVDATVSQASAAFGTTFERYAVDQPGKGSDSSYYCFTTPPSLPSSIATDVESISGVQNFQRPRALAYTPLQIQTAYALNTVFNAEYQGQNRSIGISNFDGFSIANEQMFVKYFGLPVPTAGSGTNITVEHIDGGSESTTATGEGDNDIQCTIAMAPLCNLIVYDGVEPNLLDVLTQEADKNEVDIITESYAWPYLGDNSTVASLHSQHLSMSAEGITYMCAAGDDGTALSSADYPDIDPEVLSVGGTSLLLSGDNTRSSEVGWNGGVGEQGGGGWVVSTDACNVHPTWQTGTGLTAYSSVPYRLVPDVSFNADPNNGYNVFIDGGGPYQKAGTSAAAPTCAGSLADCEQNLIALNAITKDSHGHYRLGRIQDVLYSLNGDSTVFYDIVSGTNGTLPGSYGTSNATVGWDTDSGWGPIIWSGLVTKLSELNKIASLTLNPTSIVGSYTSTATVTLETAAPSQGVVVDLISQAPANVSVPATVTVAAGATTATFTVTTTKIPTTSYTDLITAMNSTSTQTATLTVEPEKISSLTLNPSSIGGKGVSTGTVTIVTPAPVGGWTVNLHPGATGYLTMPSSVVIPGGSTSATFTMTGTAQRTATVNMGIFASDVTSSAEAILTIAGNKVVSVSFNPSSIGGNGSSTGTVTILAAAPNGGWLLSLTSGVPGDVSMPTSLTVPAGATTVTFPIASLHQHSGNTGLGIIASDDNSSAEGILTILGDTISSIVLSPSTIGWSGTSTATVNLSTAAPPNGWIVTIKAGAPNYVSMPSSITIPAGSSSGTFTINGTVQRSSTQTVGIIVNDTGTQAEAILTLDGDSLKSLALSPSSVAPGAGSTGTITLNTAAPVGGWVVKLTTGAPAYVGIPASVTVPAGATTATFAVTTKATDPSAGVGIIANDSATELEAILTIT